MSTPAILAFPFKLKVHERVTEVLVDELICSSAWVLGSAVR